MQNSRILIFFAILLATPCFLYAQQAPTIEWQKCLGGNKIEYGYSIAETKDKGYIIAGNTSTNDGDVSGMHRYDAWVIKLSNSGKMEWQKSFGGTSIEGANCIIQTTDGGFAFAGSTTSSDGDVSGWHGGGINSSDAWIVKLNDTGGIEWQKCLGGTGSEVAKSLIQTTDGGFAIAGLASSLDGDVSGNQGGPDFWVVKLNFSGSIEWQKCFGGSAGDQANSIIQTYDKGFVIGGYTWSNDGNVSGNHGQMDAWVVKIDSIGNLGWQKCLGGSNQEWIQSIIQTSDSGFIGVGRTGSNDGDVSGPHPDGGDAWVVKLSFKGNLMWQQCLGGTASDELNSVAITKDGGCAVAGSTSSADEGFFNHGGEDAWVVKLNSSGHQEWQKCLGGTADEGVFCITQTSEGGYAIVGITDSNDGDVSGYHGGWDVWVVKLNALSNVYEKSTSTTKLSISTYPNPAANILTLAYDLPKSSQVGITIYSVTGEKMKEIHEAQDESGHHEETIDLGGFPDGSYFISISACGMTERRMVQVVR